MALTSPTNQYALKFMIPLPAGTVLVACSNGGAVESPAARMTLGASATSSDACLSISGALVVAQRMSILYVTTDVPAHTASH